MTRSVLEHIGWGQDWLIETHQVPGIVHVTLRVALKIFNFKHTTTGSGSCGVEAIEDVIEGIQSLAEFAHLSTQDRVLCLHIQTLLSGDTHGVHDPAVFVLQLRDKDHQVIQVLLLSRPRSPSRFAVRFHPLPLPLVHQTLLGSRFLDLGRTPWGISTWRIHRVLTPSSLKAKSFTPYKPQIRRTQILIIFGWLKKLQKTRFFQNREFLHGLIISKKGKEIKTQIVVLCSWLK